MKVAECGHHLEILLLHEYDRPVPRQVYAAITAYLAPKHVAVSFHAHGSETHPADH